jgi:outer membrane protein OmpA-like peptidoglycan-associated protein
MIRTLFLGILLFPVVSFAQTGLDTKSKKAAELYIEADNFRVRGQYAEAINALTGAIQKDKKFTEAYYRLGIVYRSMKDYPRAINNFKYALTLTEDIRKKKMIWFDLGDAYMVSGQYTDAIAVLSGFVSAETQNKQRITKATAWIQNARFALDNQDAKNQYQPRPLNDTVNCFALQYFPTLTADQQELIFTRRRGHNRDDDEDMVISYKDAEGRWLPPQSISGNINTPENEGTCTISADGRKLIFTSCQNGYSGDCDLFESIKTGNQWSKPRNLGPNVNSGDWESHPSLSADGRTLYFVSDRKGGFGRNDIWYTTLAADGKWAKARNLGDAVNTQYDERSPFIHVNGRTLYFATSGLVGFGGYDIFYTEKTDNNWSAPVNMGSPINDHEDQYSLFITADGQKGYYSHEENLPNGQERSVIVEIQIPENQVIKFKSNYIKGVVTDSKTKESLKAQIELFDINKNEIVSIVESDSISGQYLMVLTQGSEYALYVNKKGYLFKSLNFNYSEIDHFDPVVIDIALDRAVKGGGSVLKNIFFDVDKYELKEKSATELEKIVRFLVENPQISIEIGGHTDNTGNAAYNQQLSEKRAKSVYQYLINRKIAPDRLSARGYGSAIPTNSNETEAGRQLNRRIEFTIL